MLHTRIFPYSLSYSRPSLVRNKFLLTVLVWSALANYSLQALRCYVNPPIVLLLRVHRVQQQEVTNFIRTTGIYLPFRHDVVFRWLQ